MRNYKPILLRVSELPKFTPLRASLLTALICVPVSLYTGMPIATALILAYEIGIGSYVVKRHQIELTNLRPVLDCDDAQFESCIDSLSLHPVWQVALSWLFAPLATIAVNYNGPTFIALRGGVPLTFDIVWGFIVTILVWVFFFQIVLILVRNSLMFSRLGRDLAAVDLINVAALTPFSRVGIRSVMVFAGGYAILPIAFTSGFEHLEGILVSLVISLPIALFLLLVPMHAIRLRIREAKNAENQKILRAMRGDKSAVNEMQIDTGTSGMNISGLVMYRQMIDNISEWPVDAPGVIRFALYVVIPISAWIGAAAVENFVDSLMLRSM